MNVRECPAIKWTGAGLPRQSLHRSASRTARNGRLPCRSVSRRIGSSVTRGEQGQATSSQHSGQSCRVWATSKSGGCKARSEMNAPGWISWMGGASGRHATILVSVSR